MGEKMPERIWVDSVSNDPELCHAMIYLEEDLEDMAEQDIIELQEYCLKTPLLEHADELLKLVKSQRLIMNRLKKYLVYYSHMKISHEKDYVFEVPQEIKVMKRALKSSRKVKALLVAIKGEEEKLYEEGIVNSDMQR